MRMFFILYIPPYSFCNTPVHISYLVVYDSHSLQCRVYLFVYWIGFEWTELLTIEVLDMM